MKIKGKSISNISGILFFSILFSFFLIFQALAFSQESWQYEVVSSEKLGFQTFKNSEYGFSLDYPREWDFDERKISDPVAVYDLVFSGSDTMYFEVGVWKQSDFELNTVGIDYLNYMMEWEKDQCDNSIAYTNKECTNYRLERAEIVKINGRDAYQIKHSMRDSYGYFTEIVTDFKSPDYGVTIFATANTDKFYKHENDFNAAINSFDLENADMIEDQDLTQESQEISQKQKEIEQELQELELKKKQMEIERLEAELKEPEHTCGAGTHEENGVCVPDQSGGGCLIATVTYGSELAPQVQQLRELRDNKLLQTNSGSAFMSGFNQFYYLFSPTIADWERESPIFKEAVKLTITPLLASLSLLNYVDLGSEESVLGYGIGIILMNVGMYFVAPALLIIGIYRKHSFFV